jgi:Transposase DDE domain group 1
LSFTSLSRAEHQARHLYEKLYCARGEMENRIKECQLEIAAMEVASKPGAAGFRFVRSSNRIAAQVTW